MIQIASEPLAKNYVAGVSSRSFFVSYFCYILILVIPATILVNIQCMLIMIIDSWPSYKRQLIQPTLTYYAYQISCLNDAGILVYNSNLQAGIQKCRCAGEKIKDFRPGICFWLKKLFNSSLFERKAWRFSSSINSFAFELCHNKRSEFSQ